MTLEIYGLAMPNCLFVFVASQNAERLDVLGRAWQELGARFVGPQIYSFVRDEISPKEIREALHPMEIAQDEVVYVLGAGDKGLDVHEIVAPLPGGGIVVQSPTDGATNA